jgi:hypothetical protein
MNKLEKLYNNGIIDINEYKTANRLFKININVDDYFKMKDTFKYHIVRWTPEEVLKGYKILNDGSKYTLKESFKTGITKLDLIAYIDNRFIEFSIIYNFNKPSINITDSIKEDILKYYNAKNYFKMAKRIFSLAVSYGDKETKDILYQLFNSDLGRIYVLNSDIKTLLYLFDNNNNLPINRIRKEISNFHKRLNNIKLFFNENNIIKDIIKKIKVIEKNLTIDKVDDLLLISKTLDNILMSETEKYLLFYKLLPLNQRYLL